MVTTQGKYTLIAEVQAAGTLDADSRNITFSVSENEKADLFPDCLNMPKEAVGYAVFNSQTDITIKRIRLNANGAPEAKHAPNYYAGVFNLIVGNREADETITKYDWARIKIPEWGEWYELNLTLRPYNYKSGPVDEFCTFYIDIENNVFRVDGLNLADAFQGMGVTPWLEMEIQTAEVVASSNGFVF